MMVERCRARAIDFAPPLGHQAIAAAAEAEAQQVKSIEQSENHSTKWVMRAPSNLLTSCMLDCARKKSACAQRCKRLIGSLSSSSITSFFLVFVQSRRKAVGRT